LENFLALPSKALSGNSKEEYEISSIMPIMPKRINQNETKSTSNWFYFNIKHNSA